MFLNKIKLILITGIGGNRGDFVAGWLSTLPKFIDSHWSIDTSSGVSINTKNRFAKYFDDHQESTLTLHDVLRNAGYTLSQDATNMVASRCHGHNLAQRIDPSDLKENLVKIFNIKVEPHNLDKVKWEFFCKTYLTRRLEGELFVDMEHEQRIAHVEKIIELARSNRNNHVAVNLPLIDLSYDTLFKPGGSVYLAESLGLDVQSKYHQQYDQMLLLADSPDEIFKYGKLWKRSDYFN